MSMLNSLKIKEIRNLTNLIYYNTIYINYREQIVDCQLSLKYARDNLLLKLRDDFDLYLFFLECYSLDLDMT